MRKRRAVAVGLESAAELKLDRLEIKLLQREGRDAGLVDRRGQRFCARHVVVSLQAPETETARQSPFRLLLELPAVDELLVVEPRADRLLSVLEELDLFVLPVSEAQPEGKALDRRTQVAESPIEAVRSAPSVDPDSLDL